MKLAAPTFSTNPAAPAGGVFTTAVDVTINAEADTTIFYTLDGTQPTRASQVATGPINIATDRTIRAFATKPGSLDSDVAFVSINIDIPPTDVAPPEFNPTTTIRNNTFPVALSSTTADATICVTSDGVSTPTCANGACTGGSTTYNATTGGIQITQTNTTVRALACKAGSASSTVGTQLYTLKAGDPTALPAPGQLTGTTQISLNTVTTGGEIRFNLNSVNPPTCGTANPGGVPAAQTVTFDVTQNTTVKAIACRTGFVTSDLQTFVYTVRAPAPTFTDADQTTFNETTTLTLGAGSVAGDAVCFTDGVASTAEPTCTSTATTATCGTGTTTALPTITQDNQTVKVVRCRPNFTASPTTTSTYRLRVGPVGLTYSAAGGLPVINVTTPDTSNTNVNTGTNTTLNINSIDSPATSADKVCYTLNGSAPGCTVTATTATCVTGSSDQSVTTIQASNPRNLPVTVRAVSCRPNFQTSLERQIFFGSSTTAISVSVAPGPTDGPLVNGAFANDVTLTFTESDTIVPPAGAICYTRAKEGAATFQDPACNATKTGCAVGLVYQTGDKPTVNSDSDRAAGPGNAFKVIACKPGTTGLVRDVGLYRVRTAPVTASTPAGPTTGGNLPTGTFVTFNSVTVDSAQTTPASANPTDDVLTPAPRKICASRGTAPVTPAACNTVTGDCAVVAQQISANSTAAATIQVVANEQVSVIACKRLYASSAQTFDFTVSGVAQPTFTLGTANASGNQNVYIRSQNLNVAAPSPTTGTCTTLNNTAPSCNPSATTCATGSPTAIQPIDFGNGASPTPITVRSVTCSGTATSAETTGTFTLAATPVIITAYASTTGPTEAAIAANNGVIPTGGATPAATGAQVSATSTGLDIYITQNPTTGRTLADNTDNGSICYTLDGSDPSIVVVAQNTIIGPADAPEANIAAPLNGAATPPATTASAGNPFIGGCVAANIQTTCFRASGTAGQAGTTAAIGGAPTVANGGLISSFVTPSRDPRLAGVSHTARVRAIQCKNTAYANSPAADAKDYNFTPFAHEGLNFEGQQGTGNPQQFAAEENFPTTAATAAVPVAGSTGRFWATWSATKVFVGVRDGNIDADATEFVQFYFRSGGTLPVNATTTVADGPNPTPPATGSLIGWPGGTTQTQRLPAPVNYHLYFNTATVGGLGGGGGSTINPVLRKFNGSVWETVTTGENTSIEVQSAQTDFFEMSIDRAAFGLNQAQPDPGLFVIFGDLADGGAAGTIVSAYPTGVDGNTTTSAATTGVPRVGEDRPFTIGAYLRLHLNSFRPPSYGAGVTGFPEVFFSPNPAGSNPGSTIVLESNFKGSTRTLPVGGAGLGDFPTEVVTAP